VTVAKVHFRECIQDSQEYGSDDEHMVSRVFFDLEVGDTVVEGLHADIKQVAGGSFEADPIEVGSPRGPSYRGPFNHQAFRDAAEEYYRRLVGSRGVVQIVNSTVRMYGSRFTVPMTVQFEVSGPDAGW
jgi:hypothetical protein